MPYGYSSTSWDSKSPVEQQKVRIWAESQGASPAPRSPQDLIIYDQDWGDRPGLNYKNSLSLGQRLFPNTHQATVGKDAYVQAVKDVAAQNEQRNANLASQGKVNLKAMTPEKYKSFSGSDIIPTITLGSETFAIGNISAISYSIHRDKSPVRTLGRTYPKAYVNAGRTIAGTLVFTVFDRHVLDAIRTTITARQGRGDGWRSPMSDEIPPFDVGINYRNEYGQAAYMRIYGIDIVDEGQNHSINDILSENVMQYVARDIDLMVSVDQADTPSTLAYRNRYSPLESKIDQNNQVNSEMNSIIVKLKGNLKEQEVQRDKAFDAYEQNQAVYNDYINDGGDANSSYGLGLKSNADTQYLVFEALKLNIKGINKSISDAEAEQRQSVISLNGWKDDVTALYQSESGVGKMYNFDNPGDLRLPPKPK